MRGLDILCKANIICDNTDAVSLDNGLFSAIPTIESLTSRLNRAALQEGRKLGFEVEKINLIEESLGPETVRYLLVERDANGLGEVVDGLMKGLSDFDVERPPATLYAFYHPEVSVRALDGEEIRYIPQGRAFTQGTSSIIEFNIACPPEDIVAQIARELTFFALSERAISTPSQKVANDYQRSLFERFPHAKLSKTINAFETKITSIEERFQELSSRLENGGADFLGKLESFVKRVESVPRKLVSD